MTEHDDRMTRPVLDRDSRAREKNHGGDLLRGVAGILLVGTCLGLVYNGFGLQSERRWGLRWVAEDRLAQLPEVVATDPGEETATENTQSYWTDIDDPLAIPEPAAVPSGLPEIPAVGRPVQVRLPVLVQYFENDAALLVDARDPAEFTDGHIPGAVNLPYDELISSPGLVETLDAGGRPVIAYCGGEGCEVSLGVAEELSLAGFPRVAVYVGGYPEWVEQGHPIEQGPVAEREAY